MQATRHRPRAQVGSKVRFIVISKWSFYIRTTKGGDLPDVAVAFVTGRFAKPRRGSKTREQHGEESLRCGRSRWRSRWLCVCHSTRAARAEDRVRRGE